MSFDRLRHMIGLGAIVVVPTVSMPCMVFAQSIDAAEFRAALVADLQAMREKFVQLADAIPQDKYNWRPMTGVRSVS